MEPRLLEFLHTMFDKADENFSGEDRAEMRRLARTMLVNRDGCGCHYCERELNLVDPSHFMYATFEHVNPRFYGGTDHLENLVLACGNCNQMRQHVPYEEYMEYVTEARSLPGGVLRNLRKLSKNARWFYAQLNEATRKSLNEALNEALNEETESNTQ